MYMYMYIHVIICRGNNFDPYNSISTLHIYIYICMYIYIYFIYIYICDYYACKRISRGPPPFVGFVGPFYAFHLFRSGISLGARY